ncbi:hypothetical protein PtB15_4B241 [Puccinia triticina]|nr:hypothetical protein PtB15_4B241 [Puccinia triticina]
MGIDSKIKPSAQHFLTIVCVNILTFYLTASLCVSLRYFRPHIFHACIQSETQLQIFINLKFLKSQALLSVVTFFDYRLNRSHPQSLHILSASSSDIMISASKLLAPLLGVAIFLQPVLGHCKIVTVASTLSAPGPKSHGFGVDLHGRYPWAVGQPGDAGADAVFFTPHVEYVANPQYPCGKLVTLPKGLDIKSHMAQAEAAGVATTAADGSFEALIFQVNRDGGGSCTCEFDPSGTATSWNRCKTLVNPPGIQGMWQSDRTNHTAKFQMPSSAVCQGGVFKDKCLMRIRCGWKLRFGGCFALKTPSSPRPLQLKVVGGGSSPASASIDSLAQKVFNTMQAKGALQPLGGTKPVLKHHRSIDAESRSTQRSAPVDAIAQKVILLIKQHQMKVVQPKAVMVAKSYSSSSSYG